MAISLGRNRYGKAEVRLVHVDRTTPVHRLRDLTVTGQLVGRFEATHRTGDNTGVIATDTQKNAVYALARRHGIGAPEEFALQVARYFVGSYEQVTGARQVVEEHGWDRITTSTGGPHDHAFVRGTGEVRTAAVVVGPAEAVVAGLRDLVVLKSTGSEFTGFPRVEFTTLPETDDRILATAVTARWRYRALDVDWDAAFAGVRQVLLDRFALTRSRSLQQTLYAMGTGVLEAHDEVAEIRLSLPNRHHYLVDLAPFGLDNPNEVWVAGDRPYGLIEAAVVRDELPPADDVWAAVTDFA